MKLASLLVGGFVIINIFSGCTSGAKPTESTDSTKKIRIFYNNDNFSYLEPCGCRVSPIGGMDRRWNAFQKYPRESRMFVDAGNLLFKSTQASEYLAPQWYEQAVGVIEAYNLLGAEAVALGATDLALGVEKFQTLAKLAKFPFLSSNVFWRGTTKHFLESSRIIKKQGKKIGVFALFSPELPLPSELEAKDSVESAKQMVEQLKRLGVDMIVALSHQGYAQDVQLAKQVSGIDLIVGAHSQSLLQQPDVEGQTLIVQLSNQGQMLGMVEYEADTLPTSRTNFIVDELNADYNEAPGGLANPMKALLAVTNIRMADANRKLDEKLAAAHTSSSANGYQTFLSCRECHGTQANFQEGTRHAAAFLTLKAKKQETNLDCVKCHSVGLGQPDGFRSVAEAIVDKNGKPVDQGKLFHPATGTDYRKNPGAIRPDVARWIASLKKQGAGKAFVSVQCENCHGPRPGHPFENGASVSKVLDGTCLQCHTQNQMPAWYSANGVLKQEVFTAAKQKVACPLK